MLNIVLLVLVFFELMFILSGGTSKFWEMKFVDVVNVVAQFATAGAFIVGFQQYRHSRWQERQLLWAGECKTILLKMIDALADFKNGERADVQSLKKLVEILGSLAIDFEEGFKLLDEGDHKASLRMHWQDMYFNKFLGVIQGLRLGPLVPGGVHRAGYLQALGDAKKKVSGRGYLTSLEDYFLFKEIISDARAGFSIPVINKLEMYFFVLFFFDKKHTDDYMYGNLVSLDMRSRAPLLAAIYDSQQ